jgi:Ca2+-binding RTX toxin-like protein
VVTEQVNEGTDTVLSGIASYTLGANLEALIFIGSGHFRGTGNTASNTITGGAGNDTLIGGDGNDALTGSSGDDFLDGGIGVDRLTGGTGNDTYVVNASGDRIVELASDGVDTVRTDLLAYALSSVLENLVYVGTGNFTGTGSALANIITGAVGNDVLRGGIGNDTLTGGFGNDYLDGGAGIDRLVGGTGNDTYIVDAATDVILEAQNAGTDVVRTSLSIFALSANLEHLAYAGVGHFAGTGNGGNNSIVGASGNDTLTGGIGNDSMLGGRGLDILIGGAGLDALTGGLGSDRFVFNVITESTIAASDRILDFERGIDSIDLSVIDAITGGTNDAFSFIGTAAFTAAGQLRAVDDGVNNRTIIQVNVNNNISTPELQIFLEGRQIATLMGATDFIL